MKKFLVYLCSIVVAVILGGVIGNLCVGIAWQMVSSFC